MSNNPTRGHDKSTKNDKKIWLHRTLMSLENLKLRCDERFTHAFSALKTTVATQLKAPLFILHFCGFHTPFEHACSRAFLGWFSYPTKVRYLKCTTMHKACVNAALDRVRAVFLNQCAVSYFQVCRQFVCFFF